MVLRVVDIADNGRHLSKDRGFLVIEESGRPLGRIPLDDIGAVIANAHGLTFSKNIVVALSERNIPFVFCGRNHRPAAFLWPADAHHEQGGRISDQARASLPTRKRLWAQIVRTKIEQQAAVLDHVRAEAGGFALLARKVRSGDPDNVEAQAARRYWPLLFGADFRRRTDGDGPNALLNYGYAILRSGIARAVMAAGLHPSLALAHVNRGNPFGLVDDLMEPFRPQTDLMVRELVTDGVVELNPEAKRIIASVLTLDMATARGATPVFLCMERLAYSLAQVFAGEAKALDLPRRALPLER